MGYIPELAPFQKADFRLLNAGWAFSDAVLLTGKTIREEENPGFGSGLAFPDLIDYRIRILGKKGKNPVHVILSLTGQFPLSASLFHVPNKPVYIYTSSSGKELILAEFEKQKEHYSNWSRFIFEIFDGNLEYFLHSLKIKYHIDYMDVSSGGYLIRSLIDCHFLDEIRLTQVGQLIGAFNSDGYERPSIFPTFGPFLSYNINDAPIISWKEIRTIGNHFIFIRGVLTYRSFHPYHSKKNIHLMKKYDTLSIFKKAMALYRNELKIQKILLKQKNQEIYALQNEKQHSFLKSNFLVNFAAFLMSFSLHNFIFVPHFVKKMLPKFFLKFLKIYFFSIVLKKIFNLGDTK